MTFTDRHDAGRQLATRLQREALDAPVVLALPRGGVPVAYEVAIGLSAPLEVLVARKIGAPFQPELGIGAIAEGGEPIFDEGMLARLGLSGQELDRAVAAERDELGRRIRHYRGGRPLPDLTGREAIVVDDGLATGVTARAALRALVGRGAARVILAAPVCAPQAAGSLEADADAVICLQRPSSFMAVGQWYRDFEQTSDETVVELLTHAGREA